MENLTLKELFPDLNQEQRTKLGYALKKHGVTRIGDYVDEDGGRVRKYHPQTHNFITKFAINFFKASEI